MRARYLDSTERVHVLKLIRDRWDEDVEGVVLSTFAREGIAPGP